MRPGAHPRRAGSSASAPTARRGRYVKLCNDNGRRMLTRALRLNCGLRTADHLARAVLDRHRRGRRAPGVPRPRRAHDGERPQVTRDVLVVYCHPDPASFTAAIRDRAVEALDAAGHEVRVTDLYASRVRPGVQRRRSARTTSSPDRTAPDAARLRRPTCGGASTSCSSTRRGGAVSRRCSRAGSTGCGSRGVAWDLPAGANRIRARCATSAGSRPSPPTGRRSGQRPRGRGRQAHRHPHAAGRCAIRLTRTDWWRCTASTPRRNPSATPSSDACARSCRGSSGCGRRVNRVTASTWVVCGNVSTTSDHSSR